MLAYEELGNGTDTTLLIHGIPGSRRTWRKVAPPLAAHGRVVVPDLLGFGDSPNAVRDGHAGEQAEAITHLLDRLGRVHLVGFDFGGPIAMHAYMRKPEAVRSITFAATNLLTSNAVPLPLKSAHVPLLGDAVYALMCSRVGLAFAFPGVETSRRDRRMTRQIFIQSVRHLDDLYGPIERALTSIGVPVSVIWGDHDPFFSVAAGRATAGRIPGAEFVLLENCRHLIPDEKPAQLVEAILRTQSRQA